MGDWVCGISWREWVTFPAPRLLLQNVVLLFFFFFFSLQNMIQRQLDMNTFLPCLTHCSPVPFASTKKKSLLPISCTLALVLLPQDAGSGISTKSVPDSSSPLTPWKLYSVTKNDAALFCVWVSHLLSSVRQTCPFLVRQGDCVSRLLSLEF